MRKSLAVCLVALISVIMADNVSARRFGFKGGINLTSLDYKSGMPATLGYQAGITWQWDLPLGFALQPDLLYHVKASRISDITTETFGLGYIEVPVNVQWGLRFADKNIRIFAQASPFIGYAVTQTGTVAGGGKVSESPASDGVDKWMNINRFSYGAGLGLGVQLWGIQLTAQYNWNLGQLADISHVSLSDFNADHFGGYTVSLALMFGKKK